MKGSSQGEPLQPRHLQPPQRPGRKGFCGTKTQTRPQREWGGTVVGTVEQTLSHPEPTQAESRKASPGLWRWEGEKLGAQFIPNLLFLLIGGHRQPHELSVSGGLRGSVPDLVRGEQGGVCPCHPGHVMREFFAVNRFQEQKSQGWEGGVP